ncbi:hypothetical protein [uncultured Acetobacteroides sp.]|uniref:hypothetical protein n=1 Tax=uncultured Acetobacteroides sp. TaxID=1760811 RepID=UPI0029F4B422|nr:hypothetical protein [uncultured Acetobacteroides sp.]
MDTKKIALACSRKGTRGQERARKMMHTVRKFTEIDTEKQERRLTCPGFVANSKPRV